jgi:hypothetical protein
MTLQGGNDISYLSERTRGNKEANPNIGPTDKKRNM